MKRGRGKPKALTPIEEFDVYRMHQEKKPISEIAYLYKISASTVQRIVRRLKEESETGETIAGMTPKTRRLIVIAALLAFVLVPLVAQVASH